MLDQRFYPPSKTLDKASLRTLPLVTDIGYDQQDFSVDSVAELHEADTRNLSFALKKYRQALSSTQAGVVLVLPELQDAVPPGCVGLVSSCPRVSFACAVQALYPYIYDTVAVQTPENMVAPCANIGHNVRIGRGVLIGKHATIGDDSQIGDYTVIDDHCQIGNHARIGRFNTIRYSLIGNGFTCDDHNVLGCAGYAFEPVSDGYLRIPQLGLLRIGHGVRMISHCSLDRGALGDTIIDDHVQIESQCKIGHNVRIGAMSIMVGQVALAGSVTIGRGVQIAGKVGIKGGVSVGDGAIIEAHSAVTKDVKSGDVIFGIPGMNKKEFIARQFQLKKLVSSSHHKNSS